MWNTVLSDLRAALPDRALQLVYTDLPRNDFSQLFRIVHGQTDLPAVARGLDNVYLMASGTSFHRAIVPRACLA